MYASNRHKNHGVVKILATVVSFVVVLNALAIYKFAISGSTKVECTGCFNSRKLLNSTEDEEEEGLSGLYPRDIFTRSQKRAGYVVLHIIGVCYMFLALAIACDEFFVPTLHVISTVFKISDDVAGATFMAAGGSAPEFFTSIIGVFIAQSNVGFSTIVGSAVFNVLFVIGMCAMFSKILLNLTWWPLLRDCCFYILALSLLIFFFNDASIEWWESLILFIVYLLYVLFMVFNARTEKAVKNFLTRKQSSCITPLPKQKTVLTFPPSLSSNVFRNGALQLVIHTLDPIAEVTVDHKFQQLIDHIDCSSARSNENESKEKMANDLLHKSSETNDSFNLYLNNQSNGKLVNFELTRYKNCKRDRLTNAKSGDIQNEQDTSQCNDLHLDRALSDSILQGGYQPTSVNILRKDSNSSLPNDYTMNFIKKPVRRKSTQTNIRYTMRRMSRSSSVSSTKLNIESVKEGSAEEMEKVISYEDDEEPLDLRWPGSAWERIYYLIKVPLFLCLVFTIPDVRRPCLKKFFPLSFIMCILWISVFSFLMVWWAAEIGYTAGIGDEIMGLTFLAAGTSIPDLITSVVVARQGLGDMAVSSSIGSNIFDVTVGLPLPWLFKAMGTNFLPVAVISKGLFCSTALLFIMLIAIVGTIAINKWRMTKLLGATMFLLYVAFITTTLLMQLGVFDCFL